MRLMDLVCKNIFSSDIEYLDGTRTFILLSLIWIWSFLKGVNRSQIDRTRKTAASNDSWHFCFRPGHRQRGHRAVRSPPLPR